MRLFMIACAATLAFLAIGENGFAACKNGYEMRDNGVIVYCDGGPASPAKPGAADEPDEPATTGSIGDPAAPKMGEAKSVMDCKPGQFYMQKRVDYANMMMCPK